MKVILYMTISLNGIIARNNNDEDFNSDESWKSFVDLTNKAGCLIWGRKTLENVKRWDELYLNQLKDIKKVIVSNNELILEKDYELANSPEQALEILEKLGYAEVILCGGSINNSSFAKKNLIDEIIFNIEPVVIGSGIPIFKADEFDLNLKLKEINKISEKIIQLHYIVNK
jgi:dihydrofolate reductase